MLCFWLKAINEILIEWFSFVKINIQIKRYKEGIDSGIVKDLSEEELNFEVFLNIEHIEMAISEYLDRYLNINPTGISKINKKKKKWK